MFGLQPTTRFAPQAGTKKARAGWRFVAEEAGRERNGQNRTGDVDRDRGGDRDLSNVSPGFLVVRVWFGDGLGRHGILGQKSGLAV